MRRFLTPGLEYSTASLVTPTRTSVRASGLGAGSSSPAWASAAAGKAATPTMMVNRAERTRFMGNLLMAADRSIRPHRREATRSALGLLALLVLLLDDLGLGLLVLEAIAFPFLVDLLPA